MIEIGTQIISFLRSNIGGLFVIIPALTFTAKWGYTIWQEVKERNQKQFEEYHELIKQLNQSDTPGEYIKIDRQIAVVYELRRYTRYYDVTERILKRWLKEQLSENNFPALKNEMELTLEYIKNKK